MFDAQQQKRATLRHYAAWTGERMQRTMKRAALSVWRASSDAEGVDVRTFRLFKVASQRFLWRVLQGTRCSVPSLPQKGDWWRYRTEVEPDPFAIGRPREAALKVRFGLGHVAAIAEDGRVLVQCAELAAEGPMYCKLVGSHATRSLGPDSLVERVRVVESGSRLLYLGVMLAGVDLGAGDSEEDLSSASESSQDSDDSSSTYVPGAR